MRTSIVVLAQALAAGSFQAQTPRMIASEPPLAEASHGFIRIGQVFELRDGRVVVLDKLETLVRLVDFQTRTSSMVGRIGDGPGEYRGAGFLILLGGDSVGIADAANPRILALTMLGSVADFVSPYSSHPLTGSMLSPAKGDRHGWFYTERAVTRSRQPTDTAEILRWRPGMEPAEIVARFHRSPPPGAEVTSTGHLIHRPGAVPILAPYSTWVPAPDGRIVLVSAEPYRVEFLSPRGGRVSGRVIPYQREPITEAVKEAYRAEQQRPQITYIVDRATNTTTSTKMPPPPFRNTNWSKELPAFKGDGFITFAPNGVLWIERTTIGRDGGRYDLVGPDGNLVDRVRLPDGHRVIGFGRDAMYVVRRDADDLEFLQRRPLPR